MTGAAIVTEVRGLRVEKVVTTGFFELDGGRWEVENNIYVVGNDEEVVIIDAAHEMAPIVEAVADRHVIAVVCTHGHNDHTTVAPELAWNLHAPVLLHPGDDMLWTATHSDERYWPLHDDYRIAVAGTELRAIHTPGHSPGSSCVHIPEIGVLCSGDTLFAGGPGATGRSHSSFPVIIEALRSRILTLPEQTHVLPGHGAATTIGDEAPSLAEWIARGW